MLLNQSQLLNLLLRSIDDSGWQCLVINQSKPFELRTFRGDIRGPTLKIYIWNCTHGGGSARAADEYRIQFTGVVPQDHAGAITLLLGWHAGYEVFAAWDIDRHKGQNSSSPSAQIREEILKQAHLSRFAVGTRGNEEIVVAFRPEFLVDYAISARSLHRLGEAHAEYETLNDVDGIQSKDIDAIPSEERRKVVSMIVRRYRASDFRKRVLGAYEHRCAMCGVQLELIEAAHILPVAADRSTDETNNGVALCKLHHAAYDRNLISFNEEYEIQVSKIESQRLSSIGRAEGLEDFTSALKSALILPNDRRDYPHPEYIHLAREVRGWSLT